MQADIYYHLNAEKALPLFLCASEKLEVLEQLTAYERNCLDAQRFKGRLGEVGILYNADGLMSKVYIGGEEQGQALAIAHAMSSLPAEIYTLQSTVSQSAKVMWSLAQYRFDYYKTPTHSPRILNLSAQELTEVTEEANAVFLVRDLINMPANALSPSALAEAMAKLAKEQGGEFTQWVGKELLEENFPAIYTVGNAATEAPRLLSLTWGELAHPHVILVGKGVCFDTGGLDLKPAANMRLMKKDMGGAAHVIGLAQWLMSRRLPIRLTVLVPAVENALSGQSYRPGDVITMRNGLKVEIDNTDAEGRLILADALVKASEAKPDLIINFATLTGAARVAVGTEISAMFTNNDELALDIMDCAQAVCDPVWRMPLYKGYSQLLDSTIADLANSSPSPYGGAIVAALFLQHFIEQSLSWVHFDIMAWNLSAKPGRPEGGEAMGLQAVAQYLFKRYG